MKSRLVIISSLSVVVLVIVLWFAFKGKGADKASIFISPKKGEFTVKVTKQQSKQTLLAALGLPLTTNISLREPAETPSMHVAPAEALARARDNRSDILNFQLQRLTAERNIEQAKSDNGFSAVMTANLGYNQRAPVFYDAYQNLLDQR